MVKVILFHLMLSLSFMAVGAVKESILNINESNFKQYVGQKEVELNDPITIQVDESILGGQPSVSVQVTWDSCKPLNGSSGFSVAILGLHNMKEISDSYQFKAGETQFQTTAWITIMQNSSDALISKTQSYECDLLGTESWPVTITNQVVAKLIINIDIPAPNCSISLPATITVPPVSRKNPESTVELPVQLVCNNSGDIHFVPDVSLLLTSDSGDNGHLLEDDNLILQMLYGSGVPGQEQNEWAADGDKKYPVGKMEGESRTVTPVIKATIKDNAAPEVRKINATITMNFS